MERDLGLQIKVHRAKAGLSGTVTAAMISPRLTPSLLSKWEKGVYKPRKHVSGILKFLQTDPALLKMAARTAGLLPTDGRTKKR